MGLNIKHRGSFNKLESFLTTMSRGEIFQVLSAYGQQGVDELSAATPSDSGLAASSWSYEVQIGRTQSRIVWNNDDVETGFPVAVMIQYGYGTGTGGYVQGRDYINPAMRPVFDRIADSVWKEVTSA